VVCAREGSSSACLIREANAPASPAGNSKPPSPTISPSPPIAETRASESICFSTPPIPGAKKCDTRRQRNSGGLNQEIGDFLGLRKHRHVAGGQGQGLRIHSLGRADFLFGRDHSIVGRDDEPTGLGMPRGLGDGRRKVGALCRHPGWRVPHFFRPRLSPERNCR